MLPTAEKKIGTYINKNGFILQPMKSTSSYSIKYL